MKALSLAGILVGVACSRAPQPQQLAPDVSARPDKATDAPSPSDALDQLDQRRPVPLLPVMAAHQKQNMREHLEAVQAVVAAAAVGDYDQVASAAKRMGFSETMGRMCEHMGAGAPGFTERALAFHHTADEIVTAASRRDGPAVLGALSKTLSTCTSCHATFKQQPVASLSD
jgi:cytochrome c556